MRLPSLSHPIPATAHVILPGRLGGRASESAIAPVRTSAIARCVPRVRSGGGTIGRTIDARCSSGSTSPAILAAAPPVASGKIRRRVRGLVSSLGGVASSSIAGAVSRFGRLASGTCTGAVSRFGRLASGSIAGAVSSLGGLASGSGGLLEELELQAAVSTANAATVNKSVLQVLVLGSCVSNHVFLAVVGPLPGISFWHRYRCRCPAQVKFFFLRCSHHKTSARALAS